MIFLSTHSPAQGSLTQHLAAAAQTDEETWPGSTWPSASPEEMSMDPSALAEARDYALSAGGSGMVTRAGVLVMSWGSPSETYDLKSTGKSIALTALGLALLDGLMNMDDLAQTYHPHIGLPPDSNLATGWLDEITLRHLATMTAGFDKGGGYNELLFQPGSAWAYSDGGPNWLGEALTLTYREDLHTLLDRRVFSPLGIPASQLTWRDNHYRPGTIDGILNREFGGISASVDAMARLGLLYLREGRWAEGQQILPAYFVQEVASGQPQLVGLPVFEAQNYPRATDHYGLLWWNNSDGSMPNIPHDAYWTWGLYESLILVIPSLDIVATRASFQGWQEVDELNPWSSDYRFIEPFIEPIAQAAILAVPLKQHKLWIPLVGTQEWSLGRAGESYETY
jgi:CubicO group peptidase (beta-lactamase class C family)